MEVWEEALDRSLLEVQVGALPWEIEPAALKELRDEHFKEGFKEAYEKTPDEWAKRKDRVLRMAKCAGMLAGLFADWKTGDPLKARIKIIHLCAAMAIVKPGCGEDTPVKATTGAEGKGADSPPIVLRGKPCHRMVIPKEAKDLLRARMDEFDTKP